MTTATARNLVSAALSIEHTHKSFATLTKHAKRGAIDPERALALLSNNVRDARRYILRTVSVHDIGQAAQLLLEHWQSQQTDSE